MKWKIRAGAIVPIALVIVAARYGGWLAFAVAAALLILYPYVVGFAIARHRKHEAANPS
jgi:hypothetical protein